MSSIRVASLSCALFLVACDGGGGAAAASATTSADKVPAKSAAASTPLKASAVAPAAAESASAAPPATGDVTPMVTGSAVVPGVPAKERGLVKVKDILEGFKKEPAAWVGSLVKVKGVVTSITLNKFAIDAKGVHGPDDKGTWFAVYVTDPDAPKGAESTGCFVEEGKQLADVRKAFDKKNALEEDVAIELSGPVEGSFGSVAPCKITKVGVEKHKK